MGTKQNPGDFDCYAKAEEDEPMFTLLARDPESPDLVEEWADREEFKKGVTPKVLEARECAQAMRRWAARRR